MTYSTLTRKTPLKAKSGFKKRSKKLRVLGKSDTAQDKRDIQDLCRDIVIIRDPACILYGQAIEGKSWVCNNTDFVEGIVWQADHLITRGNSATYADTRLIVRICRDCHAWKSLGGNKNKAKYDEVVRTLLPKERVELWDRCEKDSWRPTRKYASDWKLVKVVLEQERRRLQMIRI